MAKVILENTREHDITVHLQSKGGVISQVTVPGARQNPDNRNELIHGVAEVDGELIEGAKKASPVVAHYFEEGWLKPATKKAIEDQKKLEGE